MKQTYFWAVPTVLLAMCLTGCLTPKNRSAYVPTGEEGIPTIGVDPYDYQLVVEKMVTSMLKHGLKTDSGNTPVVSLGAIYNHTPFNVQVRMIGEDIRSEVMKSGLAKFTTATDFQHKGGESGDLYKQLEYQSESGLVNAATAKKVGQIVGADYILFGNIYSIERRAGGATEANFKFNLTLTEVETGLAVWTDTKPIRKMLN